MEKIKIAFEKDSYYDVYDWYDLMLEGSVEVARIKAKTFSKNPKRINKFTVPKAVKVIFNYPATIVIWEDGTKTVVKVQDEYFDEEKGFAMAFMKKVMGNTGRYFDEVKKWCEE